MLVKEFIEVLKKLPQDFEIDYGNDIYANELNTSKYDIDLYNITQQGGKSQNKITMWYPC